MATPAMDRPGLRRAVKASLEPELGQKGATQDETLSQRASRVATDKLDTLDYDRMAGVTHGLVRVVTDLGK